MVTVIFGARGNVGRHVAAGLLAAVSTTVAEVTGRRAHTFAEWATDHAHDFR